MTLAKTVFFDVDTQLDFLYPAGALYVRGAEKIIDSLSALTRYASSNRIQILSTADAHTEDDAEFKTWKPHCVAGTVGQQKASATLLAGAVVLTGDLPDASQIIVEKQKLDAFSNPKLRPLLDSIKADRYVLYGVATELCVRCAAFGLLETGARVELVSDAIKSLNESEALEFIDRFQAQGGKLKTVSEVTVSA
jgi:nicotinamidase/pyrazinamidase